MRVDGGMVHPLIDGARRVDRKLADLVVGSLVKRMRRALLDGQAVTVPGVGELSVRETRRYALVNPANGQALELGGERTLLFRPDRDLVRALNAPADQGGAEDGQ